MRDRHRTEPRDGRRRVAAVVMPRPPVGASPISADSGTCSPFATGVLREFGSAGVVRLALILRKLTTMVRIRY